MVRAACVVLAAGILLTGLGSASPDPVLVDEVLQILEESGSPASQTEVAEFIGAESRSYDNGYLSVRSGWLSPAGPVQTVSWQWRQGPAQMRGRWRHQASGSGELAGIAETAWGAWRVRAGFWGLSHGFGLLVGRPGRNPALAADSGMGLPAARMVPWSGRSDPHVIGGGGVGRYGSRWQIEALTGTRDRGPATVPAGKRRGIFLGRIGLGDRRWHISLLAMRERDERGWSTAGKWRRGALTTSWELSVRYPGRGASAVPAGLVHALWVRHRVLRLEILAGWAGPGKRPQMASKTAILGDWSGRGTALRGTWRCGPSVNLKLLINRNRSWPAQLKTGRLAKTMVDLQGYWRGQGNWRAAVRWRERQQRWVAWSSRFPWQPPETVREDGRRTLRVKAVWQDNGSRLQIGWSLLTRHRQRLDDSVVSGNGRNLLALTGRHDSGPRWRFRWGWSLSWGDSEDLVSAVVPFSGFLVPRHWGHWRSERLVGMETTQGRWRGRCAVSWRRPEVQESQEPGQLRDDWAIWCEGSCSW